MATERAMNISTRMYEDESVCYLKYCLIRILKTRDFLEKYKKKIRPYSRFCILYYNVPHCTSLHCTAPHCTVPHCTSLHCTALHFTALHCTALHCTALHCTVQCKVRCSVLIKNSESNVHSDLPSNKKKYWFYCFF